MIPFHYQPLFVRPWELRRSLPAACFLGTDNDATVDASKFGKTDVR